MIFKEFVTNETDKKVTSLVGLNGGGCLGVKQGNHNQEEGHTDE